MRKIFILVQLTLVVWTETSPIDLDSDLDQLYEDLSNLSYPSEDIDDYSKILGDESKTKIDKKIKTNIKASGFKKKNAIDKAAEKKYSIEDLKKYFKTAASHDSGTKDDGDVYGFINGLFATGLGVDGNETRTYKKGTKTRGFHRVQHKDEYKKDKEFYEDDETSGVIKKIGAKGTGLQIGGGAEFDKGYYHHDRHKGLYGKQGLSDVGSGKKQYSGYSDSQGFDEYFDIEK